ncbi:hypothetical protein ABZY81_29845 [Streptomyces sp. NPDC006514]|uniref:hypothetical protein n=1 Tax=Streptomyces sp. NPDC006514 TaxID=3154308 RepID=UPI0033BCBBAF
MTDTTTTAEATVPERAAPPEEKTWPEALGADRLAALARRRDLPALLDRHIPLGPEERLDARGGGRARGSGPNSSPAEPDRLGRR